MGGPTWSSLLNIRTWRTWHKRGSNRASIIDHRPRASKFNRHWTILLPQISKGCIDGIVQNTNEQVEASTAWWALFETRVVIEGDFTATPEHDQGLDERWNRSRNLLSDSSSATWPLHKVDKYSVLLACIVESRDEGLVDAILCLAQITLHRSGLSKKKPKTVYDNLYYFFSSNHLSLQKKSNGEQRWGWDTILCEREQATSDKCRQSWLSE